jgi:two-component system sensor histidine kinase KdpD
VTAGSLAVATAAAWLFEERFAVTNAGIVYVAAVAITALVSGTPGAVVASIAAFLLYDFFFTEPRFTFTIRDAEEWLNVLLLLFVAILVGQLAAIQRRQTRTAVEREHEARALFRVSRALAVRKSTSGAMLPILDQMVDATAARRAWIEILDEAGLGRIVADTDPGSARPSAASVHVLRRTGPDEPPEWTQVHVATRTVGRATGPDDRRDVLHRLAMDAGGRRVGTLWVLVPREQGRPGQTDTRLFAAVADQVAQAIEQDRPAGGRQADTHGGRRSRPRPRPCRTTCRRPGAIRAATPMDRSVALGRGSPCVAERSTAPTG